MTILQSYPTNPGFQRVFSPLIPPSMSFSSFTRLHGNNPPEPTILPNMTKFGLVAAILFFATGCASSLPQTPPATHDHGPAAATGRTIQVAPVVVSPFADSELEAKFERGRSLLLAEKYKEAAAIFDQLVRLSPDTDVAPPSLYNGGLAHEALGAREVALAHFNDLLQRFPSHPTARNALFKLGRLYGYLE